MIRPALLALLIAASGVAQDRWSDRWLETYLNPLPVELVKLKWPRPELPKLKTASPRYVRAVFGTKVKRQVWFVFDGETVYVDRNSNGKLTDPGELIQLKYIGTPRGWTGQWESKEFDLPATAAARGYERLTVSYSGIDSKYDSPQAELDDWRAAARTFPTPHVIQIHVKLNAVRNQFCTAPAGRSHLDSPVLHFDGPLTLGLKGLENTLGSTRFRRGRKLLRPKIAVGTPGIGRGSFVVTNYEEIPKDARVHMTIDFVGKGKDILRTLEVPFPKRC